MRVIETARSTMFFYPKGEMDVKPAMGKPS
jgi:hypothetical protein